MRHALSGRAEAFVSMSDDKNIPEIAIEPILEEPSEAARTGEDPNLGKVLKQTYTLTKKVGEGGMGNVYLALQSPLNRQVAIKMLKPTDSNPEGEHYFMREVQAINMLRHPNIITIVDFGKEPDGTLYLVMEYLPGKTLKRAIRKEFPLSPQRICTICIQILSALEQAHSKGIVHCDLKPANLMLEEIAGQADFVKVLDFGIAKVKGPAMEVGPYTQAGNIVGTFDYMSPEQIMRKDLDGRADLWSLGVIMYEMLTKKRLFHDRDAVSIIGRVMQMPIPTPEEVLGGPGSIPAELNRIVMTSLQRNVSKRFQSASDMRQALQKLLAQLESGAYSDAAPSRPITGSHGGEESPSGAHSGSLANSGLLRRSNNLPRSGNQSGPFTGESSRTGLGSLASRSGSFGSVEHSSRLATGIAQGTSVLDQTFGIEALQDSLMGERRKVAVLAVQQRAKRRQGVDPEELARRSAQEARIIKEVLAQHEGELDSFMGGTYTALFGARKTRVGDNVRAIECARALQERFQLLEQGFEHLGMGLTYGEVFLASRQGGNAYGEAIDRAIEIARGTSEARIVVDDPLINLTRQQVDYDAPRNLAGEQVAEVLGMRSGAAEQIAAEEVVLQEIDAYVPRPRFFDELMRRAHAVQQGQGGGVALLGHIGAGKTMLMEHLVKTLEPQGWQAFIVRPRDLSEGQSLGPIRHWIRLIAMTYKDPATLVRKACESIGLQRYLDEVVSLYMDDSAQVDPRSLPWGDQNGFVYFTAALLHRMVRFAIKKGPVLLIADAIDVQDRVCMELLDSFLSQIQRSSVLVLVTRRTELGLYDHGLPGNFETLSIEGFELAESRQFVSLLLGYTPPAPVIAQLHERASGNPMFLKELLRALLKRGGAQALTEQGILEAGVPLNLHELLAQRIDELPDVHRDLIAIASVLGESFREAFYYQITPAHLGPQLGLKELVAANLFEAREDMFGRVVVGFNPRALRSVVYERIPREARRKIHASIIEFLEQAAAVAAVDVLDVPMMLAFHYRSVEGFEGAAHYLTRVGRLLLDLYDYDGAIAHFKDARGLIAGRVPPHHELQVAPLLALLTALRESGHIDEAQTLIDQMPELQEIDAQFHAELLLEIGLVGMEAGGLDRSTEALFKVVELARRQQDLKLEVRAMLALAQLFEKESQLQRAANVLIEVSRKVEQLGDLDMQDPEDRKLTWTAYNQLGTLFIRQKDIVNAQKYLQVALQRAQQIQDHRGLVRVLSNLGALFLSTRDTKNAIAFFKNAVEMARATGDLLNQSRILTNLGIVTFEMNDLEASKEHFKQARTIAEEIGWYEGLADLSLHIKRLRSVLQG